MAHEISRFSDILRSTYGIVFMGTPHSGSGLARKINPLLAILKCLISIRGFGVKVEKKLVEGLKSNSRELREIAHSFTPRMEGISVISCVERQCIPGMTELVSGIPISSLSHNP